MVAIPKSEAIIMLFPTHFKEFIPYQNSGKVNCDKCQQECWIGPEQRKLKKKCGCPLVCAECLIKKHGIDVARSMVKLTDKGPGE